MQTPDVLSPSVTPAEVLPKRRLTLREFLATFQFSQGNEDAQVAIVRYLKYRHPELSCSDQDQRDLAHEAQRPAAVIISSTQRHRPVTDSGAIASILLKIGSVLNGEETILGDTLNEVAESIALRDLDYSLRGRGRNYDPDPSGHYNPYKDSWRSDLCYFGFLGNTTGIAMFDQMFADVADYWRDHLYDVEHEGVIGPQNVRLMVSIFNQHHPDMQVRLG